MSAVAALLAAGGVAVLASQDDPNAVTPIGTAPPPPPRVSGSRTQIMAPLHQAKGSVLSSSEAQTFVSPYVSETPVEGSTGSDYSAEVEARVLEEMEREWDELSAEARKEACERLKSEYPESPSIQAMDCGGDFQAVLSAVAVAVGWSVGGPIGAALAVIAVQVFGSKLEEWANAAWEYFWGDGLPPTEAECEAVDGRGGLTLSLQVTKIQCGYY